MYGLCEYCKAYSIPYRNKIIILKRIHMNSGTTIRDMYLNETNLKTKMPTFLYHKVPFIIECFDTPLNVSFLCGCTVPSTLNFTTSFQTLGPYTYWHLFEIQKSKLAVQTLAMPSGNLRSERNCTYAKQIFLILLIPKPTF